MDDGLGIDDSACVESEPNSSNFDDFLKESAAILRKFDSDPKWKSVAGKIKNFASDKKLKIIRSVLKTDNVDEVVANHPELNESQDSSEEPCDDDIPNNTFVSASLVDDEGERLQIKKSLNNQDIRFQNSTDSEYGEYNIEKSEKDCTQQSCIDSERGDEEKAGAKKRTKKKGIVVGPEKSPKLPANFKERIKELNGSDVVLVIQKALYKSDVRSVQARLSVPLKQIQNDFLKPAERAFLWSGNGNQIRQIEVMLIEPSCKRERIPMSLRRWEMTTTSTYNLTTNWNKVVSNNNLRQGMIVQLWAFREDSKLCFALVKVGSEEEDGSGGGSDASVMASASATT